MAKGDKSKGKHTERQIHVVPDGLEILGFASPFVMNTEVNQSALDWAVQDIKEGNWRNAPADFMNATVQNIGSTLKPALTFIVGGLIAKWAGKKVGLNTMGTKRLKVT